MRIINGSGSARYIEEIDCTLQAQAISADYDVGGLRGALKAVIASCGAYGSCLLTPEEHKLIGKVLQLDEKGAAFKPTFRGKDIKLSLYEREEAEKAAKMARIRRDQDYEEAIRAETTYAKQRDMDNAKAAAGKIRGDVVAKKLASTGGEQVSLSDLMGDNRFIEEHLKDSHIHMDLSEKDGWKVEKPVEKKDEPIKEPVEEPVETLEEPAEPAEPAGAITDDLPDSLSYSTDPAEAKEQEAPAAEPGTARNNRGKRRNRR